MRAFGFHDPGVEAVDPDLSWSEPACKHTCDSVECALRARVHRAVGRRDAAYAGPNVDDAGAFAEMLYRSLRGQQDTQNVDVEQPME